MTALLAPPSTPAQSDPDAFRYIHSTGLPAILERLNASLLVSTYQLGKLALFPARHERLTMLLRTFDKAMGLAAGRDRLAIGTKNSIWLLRGAIVAFLEFERRVQEIFDVQVLDGIRFPAVIGLQKDDVNHRYVAPASF